VTSLSRIQNRKRPYLKRDTATLGAYTSGLPPARDRHRRTSGLDHPRGDPGRKTRNEVASKHHTARNRFPGNPSTVPVTRAPGRRPRTDTFIITKSKGPGANGQQPTLPSFITLPYDDYCRSRQAPEKTGSQAESDSWSTSDPFADVEVPHTPKHCCPFAVSTRTTTPSCSCGTFGC